MKLHVLRYETGDTGTFGTATNDKDTSKRWDMIELPWRNNEAVISCVPAAAYNSKLINSVHFGRSVYMMQHVPGRDAIEMHGANWAGDRTIGLRADLRGCCAPGKARGAMPPWPGSKPQPCVIQSWIALEEIIELARGEDIEITFEWAPGVDPE